MSGPHSGEDHEQSPARVAICADCLDAALCALLMSGMTVRRHHLRLRSFWDCRSPRQLRERRCST